MRHEYIDIPSQPQPLQELLWRRQALAEKLGAKAVLLYNANTDYLATIAEMIDLNKQITDAEAMLQ